MILNDSVREALTAGHLAHLVTLNPDGSPQVSVVWVGLDGDEIVCAHLGLWKKVRNVQRDPRVTLSMVTGGKTTHLDNYLVISGRARVTEGGAPELLNRLAQVYVGPGTNVLPDHAPAGYITHIQVEHIHGVGPWQMQSKDSSVGPASFEQERLAHGPARSAPLAYQEIVPQPEASLVPFPLTDIQQAYWVGRDFAEGGVATHVYFEVDCQTLALDRLENAWNVLIARHPMLRAIIQRDGTQRILAEVPPYVIARHDLRDQPNAQVEDALRLTREALSHQILPADRWPLFDIQASLLSGERTRLHFSVDLLIADARSLKVLFDELVRLYQFAEDCVLPPLPVSFRDYVVAQVAQESSERFAAARAYWLDRMDKMPPAPMLPTLDQPRTNVRFARLEGRLDAPQWQTIKALAQRYGVTESSLLLAAFSRVLGRWSGQSSLTLNLTLFERPFAQPQLDDVVGDFTSILFLVAEHVGTDSLAESAQRLQHQLWRDLDHRQFSGVRVLREQAKLGRSQTLMPIVFTSGLDTKGDAYPYAPLRQLGALGYQITQTPQVHLDHQVWEEAGELIFHWDSPQGVFPEGMLADMFEAYRSLLGRLATEPGFEKACHVEILPARQRELFDKANATAEPFVPTTLQALFLDHVAKRGEAPAVIAEDGTLTYQALALQSQALAGHLAAAGAGKGERVAVVLDKGCSQTVAVLGVLRAGAAYLPIDPTLPDARRFQLFQQGGVQLALTSNIRAQTLAWPDGIRRVVVEREWQARPVADATYPDDLAYVIFTSGSTGVPKGVMIRHASAANTVLDMNWRFAVGANDRVFALSGLAFDLSVYDIFGALAAGAAVVVPTPEQARDPAAWLALLERHKVTVWNSVPALMQMLVEYLEGQRRPLPESLRLVLLSGDWIPTRLPERIRALAPKAQVINLGGATEASIWSIAFPIDKVDPAWRSIPYGRPLANQTFFVLNADLSPCPVWVPGQLFIGGLGVADGYLGDAEKTARSFIRHPRTGERLYATGDWGRYLPDGNIEFLGRQDLQVKIRGYRIELGGIEAALVQHPAVRDAVVIAQGERSGSKRLKAYVVASAAAWGSQDLGVRMRLPLAMDDRSDVSFLPGQDLSAREPAFVQSERAFIQDLKDFLGTKLPEYMVPSSIILIDGLPLTANGKVDRDALPSLEAARDKRAQNVPFVGPSTDTEKRIARVWAQLLGVERIGMHERFSELGGNSLLAIQMIGKLAHEGLEVSPPEAFKHDTIAQLAKVIRPTKGVSSVAQLVGDVALTPVQYYFLERSEDQHRTVVHVLEAEGPLSVVSLRAAVADLCHHYDALRSRFFLADDNRRQDIASTSPDLFEAIDAANSAEEDRTQTIAKVAQTLHERLDIEHGPVLRVAYLSFGPERPSSLLIAGSYVAIDNVSWRLLFADLVKAYQQRVRGQDVALPASRTTLRQVTEHLRGQAAAVSTRDCRLWVELADHHIEPLPIDFDRGPNVIWAQDTVRESLEQPTTDRLLHAFLGHHKLGINDVLLAALVETLCTWSGQRELLIELQGHGREVQLYENLDVSRLVGRLSTNYPVLLELPATEGIDRVHAVRKQLARIPRGGTDYGLMRYLSSDTGLRAQVGKIRRADVSFNYVGQIDAPAQLAEEPKIFYKGTSDIYPPEAPRRYRLVVQGMVLAGQLHFDWLYSTHHHKRATVQALASRHLETVRAYVESF